MEFEMGGIAVEDVIKFQTRIMFGAQYGRIEYATKISAQDARKAQDALILACLRIGWNDAFRHVTRNKESVEQNIKAYLSCEDVLEDEFCLKRGKVKNKTGRRKYDDYYSSILNNKVILNVFTEYASAKKTDDKCKVIQNNLRDLKKIFEEVKESEVRFGHIQKLFNIAIKFYLCLYMCREFLGLNNELFCPEIVEGFKNADCPIDSIIVDRFDQKKMKDKVDQEYKPLSLEIKWSEISPDEYKELQEKFRSDGKSGLYFDFVEWN